MPKDGQPTGPPEFNPEDEIDELFARANPNPDRVGCPTNDVLIALARKERPIEDPAWGHLAKCSPCYREWRALQRRYKAAQPARSVIAIRVLAAVAAGLVIVSGAWFFFRDRSAARTTPQVAEKKIAEPEIRAQLDLRPFAVSRSEGKTSAVTPLLLPRGRLTVTILLPTGAEPGPYEVQVLDEGLQSKAAATGQATIQNFITTVAVRLDLSLVKPGKYQVALRRAEESWRMFPAVLE